MYPSISPTTMRQLVLRRFQEYRRQRLAGSDIEERMRIEDGRVVAYSYRADNMFAMWMIDVGLVQFYDQAGNMLQAVDLLSEPGVDRRAA